MTRRPVGSAFATGPVAAIFTPIAVAPPAAAGEYDPYVRLGAAAAVATDTRFADRDCSSETPAAYFGCADGPDGRPIGAYGDFGTSPFVEVAVGRRFHDWLRAEVALGYLWDATFDGQSNFIGVELGTAPVHMRATSLTFMAHGYVDILPLLGHEAGRLQPFVSAGLGVSHNRVGEGVYAFPSLGVGDATVVPPGDSTHLAWSLGAGVAVEVSERLTLDVTYRFLDRGQIRTDPGDMRVIREGVPDNFVAIDSTRANFGTHEIGISLRHPF